MCVQNGAVMSSSSLLGTKQILSIKGEELGYKHGEFCADYSFIIFKRTNSYRNGIFLVIKSNSMIS
jgi:hypothetical protein